MKLQGLILDIPYVAPAAPATVEVPVVAKEVEVFYEVPVYGGCAYTPASAFNVPKTSKLSRTTKATPTKSAVAMMVVSLVGAIVKRHLL